MNSPMDERAMLMVEHYCTDHLDKADEENSRVKA